MKSRVFLLSELVKRDLATRYAGSFAGGAWALLNPLLLCLVYTVVFSKFLRIPTPEGFRGTYAEFLLAGLLPWIGFSEAVLRGSSGIVDNAHLIKKLPFPPQLLVMSGILSALILQVVAFSILVTWTGLSGRGTVRPLFIVGGLLLEVGILVGPVLAFAALQVFFRDFLQLLTPLLMVAFYLTPILYSAEQIPRSFIFLLALNPMADVAALFRAGLFGTAPPPPLRFATDLAVSCVIAFAGQRFFARARSSFADLL